MYESNHRSSALRAVGFLFVLVLAFAASAANAAGSYLGIGAGSSDMKDASTALIGTKFDDKDSATKITFGYEFSPNFAVEGSYIDFGTFTGSIGTTVTDRWKATGLSGSALGKIPLGEQASFFGKIGLTLWSVDDTFVGINAKESGAGLNFGLGFQFNFGKTIGLRFELEQYSNVGDQSTTGESDIKTATASLIIKF